MNAISTTSTLRWGLIGPGNIAEQFAEALTVIPGSRLHAVAGRSKHKAEQFAQDHGVEFYYDSHLALLDDSSVDAVYIATPHRYHFEQARDCLLAGKSVLCEKPMCVNAREAHELIELSRTNGVFLMEALWTRFLPIYEVVNQWLASGKIGTVTSVNSSFGFAIGGNRSGRLFDPALAGGALLDMGVYNISMSQWVFGSNPVGHSIEGVIGGTGVDEHSKTRLKYSGDRWSIFENSLTHKLDNALTIYGTQGRIRLDTMFWSATRATLTPFKSDSVSSPPVSAVRNFRATGLEYQIESAQRCIQSGLIECPEISHANTLDTMKVMDALRNDLGLIYEFEDARLI
jgi:predicted dehydrogenase